MSWVVMGREFYSSWPVRVFKDESAAKEFASSLVSAYEELRKPTEEDRTRAKRHERDFEGYLKVISDNRAQNALKERGLDPQAGGLDLSWKVIEVPDGDAE
jgi:hypothetical protein